MWADVLFMNVDVAVSLLGVELPVSKDEVNAAFKYRSRLVHPDRVEGVQAKATAEEFMKQLNMAREVLLDFADNPEAYSRDDGRGWTEEEHVSGFSDEKHGGQSGDVFEVPVYETLEEQIERLRGERQEDIDRERSFVKRLNMMLLVNGLLLVLCAGLTVWSVFEGFNSGWFWVWLVLGAVGGAGVWFFWLRVQVRFESWKKHTWLLKEYRRVARVEEKGYREALNPHRSDGFIGRLGKFFDRF